MLPSGHKMYNFSGLCRQAGTHFNEKASIRRTPAAQKKLQGDELNDAIRSVNLVSDGILVEFSDGAGGKMCYFPASFLLQYLDNGHNQIFLDYDPSQERLPTGRNASQSLHQ